MEAPRLRLDRARRDRSTWAELAFAPARNDQGHAYDLNREARFGVLWALQYDRRPQDLPLLRFLLQQEISRYRQTVPSGLAPDLQLAGFLVAEHRRLDDVWLHWQAKNISFDTALGYRAHHLLTAGVDATVEAVRSSSHPDRERILHEIASPRNPDGTPHYTDAVVEEWLEAQRARFPSDPAAESLRTWANHATRLGEHDASRRFLLAWADHQPRTEHTLNTLQFHLAQLGFLDEAIEVQKEAVAVAGPGWTRAVGLLTLVELQRRSGDFTHAWETLRECAGAMPSDRSSKEAGLWRHFVRAHFQLVPMAPDRATARTVLAEGDRQMHGVSRLWMDRVLDAAITAVEHVGDLRMRARYLAIREAELRAREQEMTKAGSRETTAGIEDDRDTTST
ncbi:hypothetical protein AB0I91_38815 [Actinosynnema sp. NPDC049800]